MSEFRNKTTFSISNSQAIGNPGPLCTYPLVKELAGQVDDSLESKLDCYHLEQMEQHSENHAEAMNKQIENHDTSTEDRDAKHAELLLAMNKQAEDIEGIKDTLEGTLEAQNAYPGFLGINEDMRSDLMDFWEDVLDYKQSLMNRGEAFDAGTINKIKSYAYTVLYKHIKCLTMNDTLRERIRLMQTERLPYEDPSSKTAGVFDLTFDGTGDFSQLTSKSSDEDKGKFFYGPDDVLVPTNVWASPYSSLITTDLDNLKEYINAHPEYIMQKWNNDGPDKIPLGFKTPEDAVHNPTARKLFPLRPKQVNPVDAKNSQRWLESCQCAPSRVMSQLKQDEKGLAQVPILQFSYHDYYTFWPPLGGPASILFEGGIDGSQKIWSVDETALKIQDQNKIVFKNSETSASLNTQIPYPYQLDLSINSPLSEQTPTYWCSVTGSTVSVPGGFDLDQLKIGSKIVLDTKIERVNHSMVHVVDSITHGTDGGRGTITLKEPYKGVSNLDKLFIYRAGIENISSMVNILNDFPRVVHIDQRLPQYSTVLTNKYSYFKYGTGTDTNSYRSDWKISQKLEVKPANPDYNKIINTPVPRKGVEQNWEGTFSTLPSKGVIFSLGNFDFAIKEDLQPMDYYLKLKDNRAILPHAHMENLWFVRATDTSDIVFVDLNKSSGMDALASVIDNNGNPLSVIFISRNYHKKDAWVQVNTEVVLDKLVNKVTGVATFMKNSDTIVMKGVTKTSLQSNLYNNELKTTLSQAAATTYDFDTNPPFQIQGDGIPDDSYVYTVRELSLDDQVVKMVNKDVKDPNGGEFRVLSLEAPLSKDYPKDTLLVQGSTLATLYKDYDHTSPSGNKTLEFVYKSGSFYKEFPFHVDPQCEIGLCKMERQMSKQRLSEKKPPLCRALREREGSSYAININKMVKVETTAEYLTDRVISGTVHVQQGSNHVVATAGITLDFRKELFGTTVPNFIKLGLDPSAITKDNVLDTEPTAAQLQVQLEAYWNHLISLYPTDTIRVRIDNEDYTVQYNNITQGGITLNTNFTGTTSSTASLKRVTDQDVSVIQIFNEFGSDTRDSSVPPFSMIAQYGLDPEQYGPTKNGVTPIYSEGPGLGYAEKPGIGPRKILPDVRPKDSVNTLFGHSNWLHGSGLANIQSLIRAQTSGLGQAYGGADLIHNSRRIMELYSDSYYSYQPLLKQNRAIFYDPATDKKEDELMQSYSAFVGQPVTTGLTVTVQSLPLKEAANFQQSLNTTVNEINEAIISALGTMSPLQLPGVNNLITTPVATVYNSSWLSSSSPLSTGFDFVEVLSDDIVGPDGSNLSNDKILTVNSPFFQYLLQSTIPYYIVDINQPQLVVDLGKRRKLGPVLPKNSYQYLDVTTNFYKETLTIQPLQKNQFLLPVFETPVPGQTEWTINTIAANNTLTLTAPHNLEENDFVQFFDNGTPVTGLLNGQSYYVKVVSNTEIQFSMSFGGKVVTFAQASNLSCSINKWEPIFENANIPINAAFYMATKEREQSWAKKEYADHILNPCDIISTESFYSIAGCSKIGLRMDYTMDTTSHTHPIRKAGFVLSDNRECYFLITLNKDLPIEDNTLASRAKLFNDAILQISEPGRFFTWNPIMTIQGSMSQVVLSADSISSTGAERIPGMGTKYIASRDYDLTGRKGSFDMAQLLCWQYLLLDRNKARASQDYYQYPTSLRVPQNLPVDIGFYLRDVQNPEFNPLAPGWNGTSETNKSVTQILEYVTHPDNLLKPWGAFKFTEQFPAACFKLRHSLPDIDLMSNTVVSADGGSGALLPITLTSFQAMQFMTTIESVLPFYKQFHAENDSNLYVTEDEHLVTKKISDVFNSPNTSQWLKVLWPVVVYSDSERFCVNNQQVIVRTFGNFLKTTNLARQKYCTQYNWQAQNDSWLWPVHDKDGSVLKATSAVNTVARTSTPNPLSCYLASSCNLVRYEPILKRNLWIAQYKQITDFDGIYRAAFANMSGQFGSMRLKNYHSTTKPNAPANAMNRQGEVGPDNQGSWKDTNTKTGRLFSWSGPGGSGGDIKKPNYKEAAICNQAFTKGTMYAQTTLLRGIPASFNKTDMTALEKSTSEAQPFKFSPPHKPGTLVNFPTPDQIQKRFTQVLQYYLTLEAQARTEIDLSFIPFVNLANSKPYVKINYYNSDQWKGGNNQWSLTGNRTIANESSADSEVVWVLLGFQPNKGAIETQQTWATRTNYSTGSKPTEAQYLDYRSFVFNGQLDYPIPDFDTQKEEVTIQQNSFHELDPLGDDVFPPFNFEYSYEDGGVRLPTTHPNTELISQTVSNNEITFLTDHNWPDDLRIVYSENNAGSTITGLEDGHEYYVKLGTTTKKIQLTDKEGGDVIAISSTGAGHKFSVYGVNPADGYFDTKTGTSGIKCNFDIMRNFIGYWSNQLVIGRAKNGFGEVHETNFGITYDSKSVPHNSYTPRTSVIKNTGDSNELYNEGLGPSLRFMAEHNIDPRPTSNTDTHKNSIYDYVPTKLMARFWAETRNKLGLPIEGVSLGTDTFNKVSYTSKADALWDRSHYPSDNRSSCNGKTLWASIRSSERLCTPSRVVLQSNICLGSDQSAKLWNKFAKLIETGQTFLQIIYNNKLVSDSINQKFAGTVDNTYCIPVRTAKMELVHQPVPDPNKEKYGGDRFQLVVDFNGELPSELVAYINKNRCDFRAGWGDALGCVDTNTPQLTSWDTICAYKDKSMDKLTELSTSTVDDSQQALFFLCVKDPTTLYNGLNPTNPNLAPWTNNMAESSSHELTSALESAGRTTLPNSQINYSAVPNNSQTDLIITVKNVTNLDVYKSEASQTAANNLILPATAYADSTDLILYADPEFAGLGSKTNLTEIKVRCKLRSITQKISVIQAREASPYDEPEKNKLVPPPVVGNIIVQSEPHIRSSTSACGIVTSVVTTTAGTPWVSTASPGTEAHYDITVELLCHKFTSWSGGKIPFENVNEMEIKTVPTANCISYTVAKDPADPNAKDYIVDMDIDPQKPITPPQLTIRLEENMLKGPSTITAPAMHAFITDYLDQRVEPVLMNNSSKKVFMEISGGKVMQQSIGKIGPLNTVTAIPAKTGSYDLVGQPKKGDRQITISVSPAEQELLYSDHSAVLALAFVEVVGPAPSNYKYIAEHDMVRIKSKPIAETNGTTFRILLDSPLREDILEGSVKVNITDPGKIEIPVTTEFKTALDKTPHFNASKERKIFLTGSNNKFTIFDTLANRTLPPNAADTSPPEKGVYSTLSPGVYSKDLDDPTFQHGHTPTVINTGLNGARVELVAPLIFLTGDLIKTGMVTTTNPAASKTSVLGSIIQTTDIGREVIVTSKKDSTKKMRGILGSIFPVRPTFVLGGAIYPAPDTNITMSDFGEIADIQLAPPVIRRHIPIKSVLKVSSNVGGYDNMVVLSFDKWDNGIGSFDGKIVNFSNKGAATTIPDLLTKRDATGKLEKGEYGYFLYPLTKSQLQTYVGGKDAGHLPAIDKSGTAGTQIPGGVARCYYRVWARQSIDEDYDGGLCVDSKRFLPKKLTTLSVVKSKFETPSWLLTSDLPTTTPSDSLQIVVDRLNSESVRSITNATVFCKTEYVFTRMAEGGEVIQDALGYNINMGTPFKIPTVDHKGQPSYMWTSMSIASLENRSVYCTYQQDTETNKVIVTPHSKHSRLINNGSYHHSMMNDTEINKLVTSLNKPLALQDPSTSTMLDSDNWKISIGYGGYFEGTVANDIPIFGNHELQNNFATQPITSTQDPNRDGNWPEGLNVGYWREFDGPVPPSAIDGEKMDIHTLTNSKVNFTGQENIKFGLSLLPNNVTGALFENSKLPWKQSCYLQTNKLSTVYPDFGQRLRVIQNSAIKCIKKASLLTASTTLNRLVSLATVEPESLVTSSFTHFSQTGVDPQKELVCTMNATDVNDQDNFFPYVNDYYSGQLITIKYDGTQPTVSAGPIGTNKGTFAIKSYTRGSANTVDITITTLPDHDYTGVFTALLANATPAEFWIHWQPDLPIGNPPVHNMTTINIKTLDNNSDVYIGYSPGGAENQTDWKISCPEKLLDISANVTMLVNGVATKVTITADDSATDSMSIQQQISSVTSANMITNSLVNPGTLSIPIIMNLNDIYGVDAVNELSITVPLPGSMRLFGASEEQAGGIVVDGLIVNPDQTNPNQNNVSVHLATMADAIKLQKLHEKGTAAPGLVLGKDEDPWLKTSVRNARKGKLSYWKFGPLGSGDDLKVADNRWVTLHFSDMTPITEDDLDAELVRQADPTSCFPPTVHNVIKLGARTFDIVTSKAMCLSSSNVDKPITIYSAPGINDTVILSSKWSDLQTLDRGLHVQSMTRDISRDFIHGLNSTRPEFLEMNNKFLGASSGGGAWSGITWENVTAGFLNSSYAEQCREVAASLEFVNLAPSSFSPFKAMGRLKNFTGLNESFPHTCYNAFKNILDAGNGTMRDFQQAQYWGDADMIYNCGVIEQTVGQEGVYGGFAVQDDRNLWYSSLQRDHEGAMLRGMCRADAIPLAGECVGITTANNGTIPPVVEEGTIWDQAGGFLGGLAVSAIWSYTHKRMFKEICTKMVCRANPFLSANEKMTFILERDQLVQAKAHLSAFLKTSDAHAEIGDVSLDEATGNVDKLDTVQARMLMDRAIEFEGVITWQEIPDFNQHTSGGYDDHLLTFRNYIKNMPTGWTSKSINLAEFSAYMRQFSNFKASVAQFRVDKAKKDGLEEKAKKLEQLQKEQENKNHQAEVLDKIVDLYDKHGKIQKALNELNQTIAEGSDQRKKQSQNLRRDVQNFTTRLEANEEQLGNISRLLMKFESTDGHGHRAAFQDPGSSLNAGPNGQGSGTVSSGSCDEAVEPYRDSFRAGGVNAATLPGTVPFESEPEPEPEPENQPDIEMAALEAQFQDQARKANKMAKNMIGENCSDKEFLFARRSDVAKKAKHSLITLITQEKEHGKISQEQYARLVRLSNKIVPEDEQPASVHGDPENVTKFSGWTGLGDAVNVVQNAQLAEKVLCIGCTSWQLYKQLKAAGKGIKKLGEPPSDPGKNSSNPESTDSDTHPGATDGATPSGEDVPSSVDEEGVEVEKSLKALEDGLEVVKTAVASGVVSDIGVALRGAGMNLASLGGDFAKGLFSPVIPPNPFLLPKAIRGDWDAAGDLAKGSAWAVVGAINVFGVLDMASGYPSKGQECFHAALLMTAVLLFL